MTANKSVKSDLTLFAIIEQLLQSDGVGVTELARELNMSKGAVHHHLQTMAEHQYVVQRGDDYHLGLNFFQIGARVRSSYDIYHAAKPRLKMLVDETGENAWCAVEENGLRMQLDGRTSRESSLNSNTILGTWRPLHCTSTGKAILSRFSRQQVESIIDQHGLTKRTENTITDRDRLLEELEQVRERGYAVSRGENVNGIYSVGAPIVDEGSGSVGALSLTVPESRYTDTYCEEELVPPLLAATNEVQWELVYE